MKLEKDKNKLIFLHIPKTGGKTLTKLIQRKFKSDEKFLIDGFHNKNNLSKLKNLTVKDFEKIKFFWGHNYFGVDNYIPFPCNYITMLRNPIERVISYYYYILRDKNCVLHNDVILNNIRLEDYVRGSLNSEVRNGQTRLLIGEAAQNKEKLDFSDLEKAKNNLEKYFSVVGITEMFDESLFLMSKEFEWDSIYYTKKNVTKNRPSIDEIPNYIIDIIENNNKLDIELYNFANKLLQNKINNLSDKDKIDLENFILENKSIQDYSDSLSDLEFYPSNIDVDFIRFIKVNKENRVAIFGAGSAGIKILSFINEIEEKYKSNINVQCFLDNDRHKWNKKIADKIVLKPELKLIDDLEIDKIIIASTWKDEIFSQLLNFGVLEDKVIMAL